MPSFEYGVSEAWMPSLQANDQGKPHARDASAEATDFIAVSLTVLFAGFWSR